MLNMAINVLEYAAVSKPVYTVGNYDKPVIGLDRDGVLNFANASGKHVWRKEEFNPIPGSLEAVALIRSKGYKIVIITNQGGIDTGEYTTQDLDYMHQYMFELLGQAGCPSVDGLYYSASLNKNDPYVKPNTEMFKRAENETGVKFAKGWYVGDSLNDIKASVKMGAKPVLVRTGFGNQTEEELQKFAYRDLKKKVTIFNNLLEFANNLP